MLKCKHKSAEIAKKSVKKSSVREKRLCEARTRREQSFYGVVSGCGGKQGYVKKREGIEDGKEESVFRVAVVGSGFPGGVVRAV